MKIHEYQAKEIFRRYGVPTPRGEMVSTPAEARAVAQKLKTCRRAVGARRYRFHAGGRLASGGGWWQCRLARESRWNKAEQLASKILGMTLVTPQTGPGGRLVKRLLVEEGLDIKRELYLSFLVDRAVEAPVIMASTAGGMEIEEVAHTNPEKILRQTIPPAVGLQGYQVRKLAFGLGLGAEMIPVATSFLQSLYRAFVETDASLVEINPLIVTGDGRLIALDAKVTFDDNALFRHKDIAELRDLDEEDPLEVEASKYKLNYIKLDGTVGCMVNGAGLAMATMDIIKLSGGSPANFLDVGGGASAEQVKNAFKILMSDKEVRGVFINVFGGILRCDVLATGVAGRYARSRTEAAGGDPHGRNECRAGKADSARIRIELHHCREHEGRRR